MALTKRFWDKVAKTDDCWLWTAAVSTSGYGIFHTGTRTNGSKISSYAHRVSWEDVNGETDAQLDHLCENKTCVRPDHVQVLDGVSHGRKSAASRYGEDAALQWEAGRCRKGHTKTRRGKKMICRTCQAENQRAYRARNR